MRIFLGLFSLLLITSPALADSIGFPEEKAIIEKILQKAKTNLENTLFESTATTQQIQQQEAILTAAQLTVTRQQMLETIARILQNLNSISIYSAELYEDYPECAVTIAAFVRTGQKKSIYACQYLFVFTQIEQRAQILLHEYVHLHVSFDEKETTGYEISIMQLAGLDLAIHNEYMKIYQIKEATK